MNFGDRVKEARQRAQISQSALARRAEMSLQGVAKIEQGGVADPHYSTLHRLAEALEVNPLWLATGVEEKEPVPLAEATLSPERALSIADDDSFRRTIEVVPTEELRGLVVELVSGYKPLSLGDARSELRDEAVRRVKAFNRAALIDEELERRGAASPEIYPLTLQRFVNATTPPEIPAPSQERADQETA